MSRDYFWLTKDQFARLKPLLPNDTRGKPRVDDRRGNSGILPGGALVGRGGGGHCTRAWPSGGGPQPGRGAGARWRSSTRSAAWAAWA